MKGIVVQLTTGDVERSKQVTTLAELDAGDVVIGAMPRRGRDTWTVTFTAQVFKRVSGTPTQTYALKGLKTWADAAWELPLGIPSRRDLKPHGFELLDADEVVACLTDLSRFLGIRPKRRPVGFQAAPADPWPHLLIAFAGGNPQVWSRRRFEEGLRSDPDGYRAVFERFLRSFVPAPRRGFKFEEVVKELFEAVDPSLVIAKGSRTGDGGVDLSITRSHGLLRDERILVQTKCTTKPIQPNTVRELQGVCSNRKADRGILVSLGDFTREARAEAERSAPPIQLLGPDALSLHIWEHLTGMTKTHKEFQEWCMRTATGQGSLF